MSNPYLKAGRAASGGGFGSRYSAPNGSNPYLTAGNAASSNPFSIHYDASTSEQGNPFAATPGGFGSRAAAPAHHSGGLFGTIGHVFSQGASDLEHAAINAPAGVVQLAKADYEAAKKSVEHPWISTKGGFFHPQDPNAADNTAVGPLGHAYLDSLKQSVEHPLRHPGYTALNLAPVAGGLTRAGLAGSAVAGAVREGDIGGALKAATARPNLGPRTLRSGGLEVHPETSRSALGQVTQHGTDKLLQKAADKNPGGNAASLLNRRIGKTITAESKQATRNAKGPAARLIALGSRLTPAENKALQVVAEETPLEGRITATSARITGAKDAATRARHQEELALLHEARQHLTTVDGKPALAPDQPKLAATYKLMQKVSGGRENLLKSLGLLSDEAIKSRTSKAGRVSLGAKYEETFLPASTADLEVGATVRVAGKKTLGKVAARTASNATVYYPRFSRSESVPISSLEVKGTPGIKGAENFNASENAVRIPDVATKRGTKTLTRQARVGGRGTIGHPKAPGSVTHEYKGTIREQGLRRQDTAQLVGESGLEAAKYAGLLHVVEMAKQAAQEEPTRTDDFAIRLDNSKSSEPYPLEVRKFLADPEEYFNATPEEQASMFEKARSHLFIAGSDKGDGWEPTGLDEHAREEFHRLYEEGKIGFVPRRILGELANASAPLRSVGAGKGVGAVDAINNAQRFAILYLKPAYAIPNILGNAALNLIQQGWAAPRNLAQAARLVQKLGDEDYAAIDTAMGEGLARAVSAHGTGKLSRVVDFAAGKWSKAVDTPFRRASFLYEARQAGFKTPAQLHELLTRDAHDPQLIEVGIKANRDAIDYENLSNVEREVIRRVVFFYPWVKGSTVYAGRFLREHPVKAAATGALGQQGQKYSEEAFGALPSYLEGLIPFGSNRAFNPSSAAILQTPAQLLQAVQGITTGNIPEAAQAMNFATPALALLAAEATRRDSGGFPYRPGTSGLEVARDILANQLPQVSLYNTLKAAATGKGGSKLYPPSVSNALGQFLLGGVYPRKIDKARVAQLAASEQAQMRSGR